MADALDADMTAPPPARSRPLPLGGTNQSGLHGHAGTEGLEACQETKYTGILL
ncbi:hypothetical protein [Paenarthrobacter sp. 2TAF44]|uniref:hypothetical protein n=1 Tax=Paenarthrobacter sp. 2TAF44 TaxID=3233018 RepID=UPI003F957754